MTTSTRSANAEALPSAIHAMPQRRGFLAGLAALPLIGGSVALLGRAEDAVEPPRGLPDADRLATLDDYAAARFEAVEVDFDAARSAYGNMWTPLAIGLCLMAKSSDQCRDVAAGMGDDLDGATTMLTSLRDGAAWYRQAAELIESAECRFLSGAARVAKEDEATGGLDA